MFLASPPASPMCPPSGFQFSPFIFLLFQLKNLKLPSILKDTFIYLNENFDFLSELKMNGTQPSLPTTARLTPLQQYNSPTVLY